MKPRADVPSCGQGLLCSAHRVCQWVSPSLAVHPSTALNGPGRLNGALRNGSQFPGRQGGAVPRPCVRARCWEGFTSFPWLLSPGEVGYLFLHLQSLCFMGEDMDESVTFALAMAQAVLCSSWEALGCSFAPVTSTAFTDVQGHREAMQLCLWVQCTYNTPWGRSDPQRSHSAVQEYCTAL